MIELNYLEHLIFIIEQYTVFNIFKFFLICKCISIMVLISLFIYNYYKSKYQLHSYLIPIYFLNLIEEPKSYFRRRRNYSLENLEAARNQVKWKSPVQYPPKIDKDIFKVPKKFVRLDEMPVQHIHEYKMIFKRPWQYLYEEALRTNMKQDILASKKYYTELIFNLNRRWDYNMWFFVDQYLFTIPVIIIFLYIHWTVAQLLLTKFKCQQHYILNKWIFGVGFIYVYYVYSHITKLYKDYYLDPYLINKTLKPHIYNFFLPEWPAYIILYDWWLYLIIYSSITITLFIFAPKTIYLRSNEVMDNTSFKLKFISIFIGLLLPFIFAQQRLPFWQEIEGFIFNTTESQNYKNIVYLIIILIILNILSILVFYFIIIIPNMLKAYIYVDNTFYKDINWLLYSNTTEDSDWDKKSGLPYNLKNKYYATNKISDNTTEWDMGQPTGFKYRIVKYIENKDKTKQAIFDYIWIGSYSRNLLVSWYICMGFYCIFLKYLYSNNINLLLIKNISLILLCILSIIYLYIVIKYLKINLLEKRKNKIIIIIYFLILILVILFF